MTLHFNSVYLSFGYSAGLDFIEILGIELIHPRMDCI